jgi:hypothetical protein
MIAKARVAINRESKFLLVCWKGIECGDASQRSRELKEPSILQYNRVLLKSGDRSPHSILIK